MLTPITIGVIGPGESATPEDNETAYELGKAIAHEGWMVLTGGREFGVMNAVMKGAADNDGLTIGVLPTENTEGASPYARIKIVTGIGNARNNVTVLSSHCVVVCGMAPGTASEVALAIKARKKVIMLNQGEDAIRFFKKIGEYQIVVSRSVEEAITQIREVVTMNQASPLTS